MQAVCMHCLTAANRKRHGSSWTLEFEAKYWRDVRSRCIQAVPSGSVEVWVCSEGPIVLARLASPPQNAPMKIRFSDAHLRRVAVGPSIPWPNRCCVPDVWGLQDNALALEADDQACLKAF